MAEHASLEIDGAQHEVTAAEGVEALSSAFRYDVTCVAGPASPEELLGRDAHLTLRDPFGAERHVHGVVREAVRHAFDDGSASLALEIRPKAYLRSLGRDSRTFRDASVVDVVEAVLRRTDAPTRWELGEAYPAVEYRAQYREDDWTFVSRLLEDEGIYTYFDHQPERSTLVFADTSTGAPELAGGAAIAFALESALVADREVVVELGSEIEATPTRFTLASFDPARPLAKVAASEGDGDLETYDAPGAGPTHVDACARRARVLREAAVAAGNTVAGLSSSVRLAPGLVMAIEGHPIARYDRRYLLTEVSVSIVQRRRGAAGNVERPYACRFRAIPADHPYRPPHRAPRAAQAGLQSGVIVGRPGQEIHPDATGRVRCQLHWDREGRRDDTAGTFMRVAQRGTADSMLLPRVGWTALTFNEEGSIDAPSVLGRVFDAEHPPPYALPANATRVVYKTATTPGGGSFNEVHFEDGRGAEKMFLGASRDMGVLVQNDAAEKVKGDAARQVGADSDLGVVQSSADFVGGDHALAIGGDQKLEVVGGSSRTVDGREGEAVGGSRSLGTGKQHSNKVANRRALSVGTALIDATLGPIKATGDTVKVLVGGAMVKVSAKTIAENVRLASVQAVGGLKVELARAARKIEVKGRHVETVGGSMVLKSAATWSSLSANYGEYRFGAALDVDSPAIRVTAQQKVLVVCGKSSILVTPDEVVIRGASIDTSGATLAVEPKGLVKLNP